MSMRHLGAFLLVLLALVGCTGAKPVATTQGSSGSGVTAGTTVTSAAIQELVVSAPDLSSQPEEVIKVGWGTGSGQVSLGDGDFGKGGPEVMAVSPDGKTIAVYDMYGNPPRVNFYAGGAPAGAVNLKTPPMAIAISNSREVYALYPTQPISTVLHLSSSGEVLHTLQLNGSLDPTASLFWAGSSLHCYAGVGGTDRAGYLWVFSDGTPMSRGVGRTTPDGLDKDYPLASGYAAFDRDPAGGFQLTVTEGDASPTAVHLTLPPALTGAGGELQDSAFDGFPVIALFLDDSQTGQVPTRCFVAVDVVRGQTKTAIVRLDWKVPGGGVGVGLDAVYVMSLDFATGMQLLRVPFK